MRVWPRTLGVQINVVKAEEVLLSNLGVELYIQLGNERMNEASLNERAIDRAASTATVLSAVPARAREDAAKGMTTGVWTIEHLHGKPVMPAMTEEEQRLAARLQNALPDDKAAQPVSAKYIRNLLPPPMGSRTNMRRQPITQLLVLVEFE